MKAKLVLIALLASVAFASCKKKQCPAYGKITPTKSVDAAAAAVRC